MPAHGLKSVLIVLAILSGACGGLSSNGWGTSGGDSELSVVPLAKIEGWRNGVDLLSLSPPLYGVLEVAYDSPSAQQLWEDNTSADLVERDGIPERPGIYGDLNDVDFDTHVVAVWSAGESGTCPGFVSGVDVRDSGSVEVSLQQVDDSSGPCTADHKPYRMIFALERDRVPRVDDLPTDNIAGAAWEGLETDVLVTEYPGYAKGSE